MISEDQAKKLLTFNFLLLTQILIPETSYLILIRLRFYFRKINATFAITTTAWFGAKNFMIKFSQHPKSSSNKNYNYGDGLKIHFIKIVLQMYLNV